LNRIETDEQKEGGDKIEEGAESIDEIGSADEDDLMKYHCLKFLKQLTF
jgi:hypothetical protein